MKQTLFIIGAVLFVTVFAGKTYAVTASSPTPVPTAANGKLDAQINELKEKIASRVSELNLVEKRGIVGLVTEVKGNQVTLTDIAGNTRFADVDEITKFSSTGANGFGLSDLKAGSSISILGIYNKQSKRILARFIKTYSVPTMYSGAISALTPKTLLVTMATNDKKSIVSDVNPPTKISAYAVDTDMVRYTFAKLAVGDRILVVGYPDKKDPNIFSASRLLDLIGIPKDPNIDISISATPTPATSVTPTPPTGKKLNPIR